MIISMTPSLRRDQDDHPLLLKLFANRRIVYPAACIGCGMPQSADAALQLRATIAAGDAASRAVCHEAIDRVAACAALVLAFAAVAAGGPGVAFAA